MSITTNYSGICIFTKHTNLLQWFDNNFRREMTDGYCDRSVGFNQLRHNYERHRDVQLILLFRYDTGKCFCKIRCPINPLPVKGEFEVPSLGCVQEFLKKEGWEFKQKLHISFLK